MESGVAVGGKITDVFPWVVYVFAGLETPGETISSGICDESRAPHSGRYDDK